LQRAQHLLFPIPFALHYLHAVLIPSSANCRKALRGKDRAAGRVSAFLLKVAGVLLIAVAALAVLRMRQAPGTRKSYSPL
jgi:hypothetical protein